MTDVDQYGKLQVLYRYVMGWYISMGNYIVNVSIPSKTSLGGMIGLTNKYSFKSPPTNWGEYTGNI